MHTNALLLRPLQPPPLFNPYGYVATFPDKGLTGKDFFTEVGYAQGMNDIMSRFLIVMDTEAEAFWMFVNYMEHFKNDFMEEGMLRKVGKRIASCFCRRLRDTILMKMDFFFFVLVNFEIFKTLLHVNTLFVFCLKMVHFAVVTVCFWS